MSDDDMAKQGEADRRDAAKRRAAERASGQAVGEVQPWSAEGELPGPGWLFLPVALGAGVLGFVLTLLVAPLSASVFAGLGAAVVAGVVTRRRGPKGALKARDPRLQRAYADALDSLRAADGIDADRRAAIEAQLGEALQAVDRLVASGAPGAMIEERVADFQAQAVRLRDSARAMTGGDAIAAGAALDGAIGDLAQEARAHAEVEEALEEATGGAASRNDRLLE